MRKLIVDSVMYFYRIGNWGTSIQIVTAERKHFVTEVFCGDCTWRPRDIAEMIRRHRDRVPATDLRGVAYPTCARRCAAIVHLGCGECENVCPHKFTRTLDGQSQELSQDLVTMRLEQELPASQT